MSATFQNPGDDAIRDLLKRVRTIAVVGLSPRPARPSYGVSRHMQEFGYKIVPVRPAVDEVLGERAFPDLRALPECPDLVNVFRAPQYVPAIVDDCIALGVKAVWLQLGVVDEPSAVRAQQHGLTVVMDRCVYQEYLRLFGPHALAELV